MPAGGVPHPLRIPTLPTLDTMSKEEFDAMMERGEKEAEAGQRLPLEEAFAEIDAKLWGKR